MPEFTPRLHYLTVSLYRARLSLKLAQITKLLLCIHAPELWEQNETSCIHTEVLQQEASFPLPIS